MDIRDRVERFNMADDAAMARGPETRTVTMRDGHGIAYRTTVMRRPVSLQLDPERVAALLAEAEALATKGFGGER